MNRQEVRISLAKQYGLPSPQATMFDAFLATIKPNVCRKLTRGMVTHGVGEFNRYIVVLTGDERFAGIRGMEELGLLTRHRGFDSKYDSRFIEVGPTVIAADLCDPDTEDAIDPCDIYEFWSSTPMLEAILLAEVPPPWTTLVVAHLQALAWYLDCYPEGVATTSEGDAVKQARDVLDATTRALTARLKQETT